MPFDPTGFKMPENVTILPPTTPPEEPGGGGGGRMHIVIELVERRPPAAAVAPRMSLLRALGWVVFWLFIVAALAHAEQPKSHDWPWSGTYSYRDSIGTRWTFPQDQTGGGHGCMTQRGGDDIDRTECW